MPTDSYHDSFIKRLEDPEYSSIYIETALEEVIKDREIVFFRMALENVLEAAEQRRTPISEIHLSRQQVYRDLLDMQNLTIETAESVLETVGIVPEREPAEV